MVFNFDEHGDRYSIIHADLNWLFKTMPYELEEATRIDGAGNLRVLWHVMLPLMRPALGTVVIINFIASWNDFFFPLILLQKNETDDTCWNDVTFGEHSADWGSLLQV